MSDQENSYRQIFKATSLFGGVQVFNIGISIIRSKVIAVLLGPTGMGIAGLLTTSTGLVGGLTSFGLSTSAVKDVAAANESGDIKRVSTVVSVIRRLVWFTGLLGCFVTIVFSPVLSRITFGNKDYTIAFIWLSINLLITQLTGSQNVLLQGIRKLHYLAKANMIGSFAGLIISIPVYYYWRVEGIVAAILITSLFTLIISSYFASKANVKTIRVTTKEVIREGTGMMKMGLMLSLGGLITTGASYLVSIFIRHIGSVEDVGLYSAGFAIISTYVGLVFSAMGTDYYPRLSGVAHDNIKARQLINQQAEVAILILSPILSLFLIFFNWLIILFYSTKFIPVNGMLQWAALGMYFKAASWSISFILLAKGASKIFFWNELTANIYLLGLNMLGYKMFGLDGLGISFMIGYLAYFLQVFFLAKHFYQFSFNNEFSKIFGLQLIPGLLCFVIVKFIPSPWSYFAGIPIICLSALFSLREIDKRVALKSFLTGLIRRNNT